MKTAKIELYAHVDHTCNNCALLIKKGNRYRCGAHADREIYIYPYSRCGNGRFRARLSIWQKLWIKISDYLFK